MPLRLEVDEPRSALRALSFELRDAKGEETVDLGDLVLVPPYALHLRIVGPDDRPVEKASVVATPVAPPGSKELARRGIRESSREVLERGTGEYAVERLPPGRVSVSVVAHGFASKPNSSVHIELPHDEPVLIRLEEGARLAGTVRDTKGNPIPNAKIEARGRLEAQSYEGIETDDEGRFDAAYILPDKYLVHVDAKDFASERKEDVPSGTADLEFVLPREAVVSGKVLAEDDGSAIERASVHLTYETENTLGISGHNTQTDADGRFSFHQIPPGRFMVSVQHEGFLPSGAVISLELTEGQRVEDQVFRLGRGLQAAGRIVDSVTTEPIAGARVTFHHQNPERMKGEWHSVDDKSATTASDGAFTVKGLIEGTHEISWNAKGYFRKKGERVAVAGRSIEGMELTLDRGGTISGQVLDSSGKPVAEARVFPRSQSQGNDRDRFGDISGATTGAEGRFTIVGLPEASDYTVEARHDTYARGTVGGVSVKARQDVTGVEIRLSAGGSISGRVRDARGNGIVGTRIYVSEEVIPEGRRGNFGDAETDPTGNYEIRRLPTGTYQVRADSSRFKGAEMRGVQVKEGQPTTEVDLTLADGHSLSGRVLDSEGRPIEGATARLTSRMWRESTIDSETTDANGRFTLKWSDEMSRSLSASKDGYETAYFREGYNIDERLEEIGEVNLVLERSATITGQVRAPGQNSLKELNVFVAVPGRTDSRMVRFLTDDRRSKVDPSGVFEVTIGGGTHTVQGSAQGFAPVLSSPITVKPGERREGVFLDLVAEGQVEGRVLRRGSGQPIGDTRVSIRPVDKRYNDLPESWTPANGRFSLDRVPPGEFDLVIEFAQNKGRVFPGYAIASGEKKEINVEIDDSGGVRGIVRKAGRGIEKAHVSIEREAGADSVRDFAETDGDGRFELPGLLPGTYRIHVSQGFASSVWLPARRVSIPEGRFVDLEFDLDAGIRLRGRAVLGGSPAAGCSITAESASGARWSGSSDADETGAYSLLLPEPGAYTVGVGRGARCFVRYDLLVPEGPGELEYSFQLPSSEIAGVVVDALTGQPLSEGRVAAVPPSHATFPQRLGDRAWKGWSFTDQTGRFALSHLPPGDYVVWAWAEGHATSRTAGIRVEEAKVHGEHRIALEAEIVVQGRVVDGKGFPVEDVIGYVRDGEGNVHSSYLRSESSGSLKISGLGKGPYSLIVLHPSFARAQVNFEAGGGGEPVTVRLEPGGSAEVLATDTAGKPAEGVSIEIIDSRGVSLADEMAMVFLDAQLPFVAGPDGLLTVEHLAASAYRARARKGISLGREETFTIETGRTTRVKLLVSP